MRSGTEFLLLLVLVVLFAATVLAFNDGVRSGFKALAISALVLLAMSAMR